MEKKISYRFLNTKEGQKQAHEKFNEMKSSGLNPMMTWGVKWIIIQTDYIEES